jgi:CAAX prenyl protease-like protein
LINVEDTGMKASGSHVPESLDRLQVPGSDAAGLADILPYIAPILTFLVLTNLEGFLPDPSWYPLAYAAKVLVVALVAWHFRSTWHDLRPISSAGMLALSVMVGLIVFVLWVRLDGYYPEIGFLGKRTGFDPSSLNPRWKWPFVAIRFAGLALLVPLIEELFWRSFLVRWLIDPDYWKVPIGRVTPMAASVTSALFALAHPEWLPALLTGFLWAWLLWQTKSLSACVISHSVANLALGLHVLVTGDWRFW